MTDEELDRQHHESAEAHLRRRRTRGEVTAALGVAPDADPASAWANAPHDAATLLEAAAMAEVSRPVLNVVMGRLLDAMTKALGDKKNARPSVVVPALLRESTAPPRWFAGEHLGAVTHREVFDRAMVAAVVAASVDPMDRLAYELAILRFGRAAAEAWTAAGLDPADAAAFVREMIDPGEFARALATLPDVRTSAADDPEPEREEPRPVPWGSRSDPARAAAGDAAASFVLASLGVRFSFTATRGVSAALPEVHRRAVVEAARAAAAKAAGPPVPPRDRSQTAAALAFGAETLHAAADGRLPIGAGTLRAVAAMLADAAKSSGDG